jgi:hypothetical protein
MHAAYQALIVLGELKAGEHVLIYAAASGVGIAAIQLARLLAACVPLRPPIVAVHASLHRTHPPHISRCPFTHPARAARRI